jgi:hypothetical protein
VPSNPTVFVTNLNLKHDMSAALRWGALRPLSQGGVSQFQTHDLLDEIADGLAYSTDTDYLILSGHSVIAALTLTLWLTQHKQCNLLLYDERANEYLLNTITRNQLDMTIADAMPEGG